MAKAQTIDGFISDITTDGSAVHRQSRPVTVPKSTDHKTSCAASSSSSSATSERCQKISIASVPNNNNYNDDSSVVDSDSDNENLTIATVAKGARTVEQCEAVELQSQAMGSMVREMGQLQNISNLVVSDSSNVSIGSKFIFEDGSKITLVVKDKSGPLNNGYSNGGFVANGDLEQNRKPSHDLTTNTPDKDVDVKFKLLAGHRKYLVLLITFGAVALLVTTVMLLNLPSHSSTYAPGDGDDLRKNIPIDSTIGNDLRTKGNHALRHVTRDEWLAQPANDGVSDLQVPVARVIVSHSVTDVCMTQAACTFRTRLMQTFHIESRGWSDIGYNFLVGGDGNVYDGRGWDQEGAHTKDQNRTPPEDLTTKDVDTKFKLLVGYKNYLIIATFTAIMMLVITVMLLNLPQPAVHVTRDAWLALPAKKGVPDLQLPVARVIVSHSVTDVCMTQDSCSRRVSQIQKYHIVTRGWSDIGYNFLIGGDGKVYDGRGWDQEGAHTKGYNRGSVGVCFIGNFNTIIPPDRQLNAFKQLLKEGVDLGKLTKDFKLLGARQVSSTESPGAALFQILKTLNHFSEKIE